jgi:O-antigen/teichoic acid export membrane protein
MTATGSVIVATGHRLQRARRDGTTAMLLGSLIAGLAAYAWQAAGTRVLGEVAFAPVAAAWSVLFLVSTVLLVPVEQYATRTIAARASGQADLVRKLPALGLMAVVGVAGVGAATFALSERVFGGRGQYAAICALIVALVGVFFLTRGVFAGQRQFASYGHVTAADALARLALGLLALILAGESPVAFAWTIPLGSIVVGWWIARRPLRFHNASSLTDDAPPLSPWRFMGAATGSTAAAQVIFASGPLALALLGARAASVTILFVTQTAFRSVMLVAMPFWARLLPTLTVMVGKGPSRRLPRILTLITFGTIVGAAVLALAALFVAPPTISLLFGQGVRPTAGLSALVAAATGLAVGNLGLSQILVAAAELRALLVSWWVALAVFVAWVPLGTGGLLYRVAWAGLAGESAALVGLATVVAIRSRRR